MNGNFGYIKTKKLKDKEYKRTSMKDEDFTSNSVDTQNAIEITKSNLKLEEITNFNVRKEKIQSIISEIISKGKFTINLNLDEIDIEEEKLERFIIELKPRLKEIGGSLVITNNNILSNEFIENVN